MSETRKKTHIFMVRAEPAEAEEIQFLASQAGLSVPELFRRSVLHRKVNFQAKLTADALVELSRIGNNLNQISRAHNSGQHLIYDDVSHTLAAIRRTSESLTGRGGATK
jgi:hypothetical protein